MTSTTEPRRLDQRRRIAQLGAVLALAAGLTGCAPVPARGPVPPVLHPNPFRIGGPDFLAPPP